MPPYFERKHQPCNNLLLVVQCFEEQLDLTPDRVLLGHLGVVHEAGTILGARRRVPRGDVLQALYDGCFSTTILKGMGYYSLCSLYLGLLCQDRI